MILGIDVGGTHTDAALIDGCRVVKKAKVPTDNDSILLSLLEVTKEIIDNSVIPLLERVVLSTTISTNAIVQNKIERVGMLISSGPGVSFDSLNVCPDTHFLSGSINHRGKEMETLNAEEAKRALAHLTSSGIKNIGIVGKFSIRNPKHEFELMELARNQADHVTIGHNMSGRLNFPRRISTTFLNEAVWRIYREFVHNVSDFISRRGVNVPIYILKADGGVMELSGSAEFPVQTILSGPAASIMGIMATTRCKTDSFALDIGGTTTDISVFAEGVPLLEPFGVTIENKKTLIRGLRTRSIGVGGDSVVRMEKGALAIGPDREGPAAGLGGLFPTPTDAMIVLGLTTIGDFQKACNALAPLAESLCCGVKDAAMKIYTETCRKIASASVEFLNEINDAPVYTIHEMLDNRKLEPENLFAVGGPAREMAGEIARLLKTEFDIPCDPQIPVNYEIANAIGAALSRTTAELTVLADTERRLLTIAEEGSQSPIPATFTLAQTAGVCRERLRARMVNTDNFNVEPEIEIVESQEFNIVDEFYTVGRNIRVKGQIKPGIIKECR
jgi:N-methylhydantoinase A/oxoprolinase/acetone carboxylase beta subunit